MSALLWYLAGVLTIPAVIAAWAAVSWCVARERGRPEAQPGSSCYVCTHAPVYFIGERTNLSALLGDRWHRYVWASRRWHRDAWRTHPIYVARTRRSAGG